MVRGARAEATFHAHALVGTPATTHEAGTHLVDRDVEEVERLVAADPGLMGEGLHIGGEDH